MAQSSGFAADRLQAAIFSVLQNNVALNARINAIYDAAPTGALAPYITFGETSSQPWDTKTEQGAQINFDILVWTDAGGQMQAKEIMVLADAALHYQTLTIVGFDLVSLYQTSGQVLRVTRDGTLFSQGRLRYRAVLQQITTAS